jgi:uncharacterized protein (DUF169 family)
MQSQIAAALQLKYSPVAILWSDEKPEGAMQFAPGRWGCVMAAFAAAASQGKVAAFDRETYGCWGGGVGLGLGNAYEKFPGGVECFCRFLSSGNEQSEQGRGVAEACAGWMKGQLREEFLHGERYFKGAEQVQQWLAETPITDIPAKYVVFKPLGEVAEGDEPKVVVMLANPDQMSALVVLAGYGRGGASNTIIPYAAGCQTIGIFAYREAAAEQPRAVVGLTDLSARKVVRRLGKDLVTVALPYKMFREMEGNVEGSFLEKETWKSLMET